MPIKIRLFNYCHNFQIFSMDFSFKFIDYGKGLGWGGNDCDRSERVNFPVALMDLNKEPFEYDSSYSPGEWEKICCTDINLTVAELMCRTATELILWLTDCCMWTNTPTTMRCLSSKTEAIVNHKLCILSFMLAGCHEIASVTNLVTLASDLLTF